MDNHYQIADRGDLRKYRTEIPNVIDDMELSVYAFRLYVHLKRVAGDSGKCYQSTSTIARSCNMSAGMVSQAKVELSENELIIITVKKGEHGEFDSHLIEITDIWPVNFSKYSARSYSEQDRSQSEQDLYHTVNRTVSPHEPKKEQDIKKEHIKWVSEILETWKALFPEKPQPKPTTISAKVKTRMENEGFQKNWKAALERGAKTKILHQEGWFNLAFFLRNDESYQKVLDGWMDWKDEAEFKHNPTACTVVKPAPAKREDTKGLYV